MATMRISEVTSDIGNVTYTDSVGKKFVTIIKKNKAVVPLDYGCCVSINRSIDSAVNSL
jgi:hypothetical protein